MSSNYRKIRIIEVRISESLLYILGNGKAFFFVFLINPGEIDLKEYLFCFSTGAGFLHRYTEPRSFRGGEERS